MDTIFEVILTNSKKLFDEICQIYIKYFGKDLLEEIKEMTKKETLKIYFLKNKKSVKLIATKDLKTFLYKITENLRGDKEPIDVLKEVCRFVFSKGTKDGWDRRHEIKEGSGRF
ncbi:unnamed protein product [Meloidogyne enterolobii]|uniref:Uncharacterized protein n=1 Tax=Meloidogyne enterolobii TaxID=390850 RepID=A0ACB0ZMB4_MELEN